MKLSIDWLSWAPLAVRTQNRYLLIHNKQLDPDQSRCQRSIAKLQRFIFTNCFFFSENRKKKWEKMREKCNKQQLDLVAIKNCCAPGATLLPPIMKQTSSSFPGGGARVGGAPGEWRMPWGCESCEETCRLNGEVRKNWLAEGLFLVFHELKTLSVLKQSENTSCVRWLTARAQLQEIDKVCPDGAEAA